MKRLGVIGGLGPLATAHFYDLILQMTDAQSDQEHIEIVIYSKPTIPDRTEYILGKSKDNPAIPMLEIGQKLVSMGAENIAIPCMTAHYFMELLSRSITAPIIHGIREIAQYMRMEGIRFAGLLATEGTIAGQMFQQECKNCGIECLVPANDSQKAISGMIYQSIKANRPVEFDRFREVSRQLRLQGAEILVLGCTELSLLKRDYDLGEGYLDSLEVLAMRSIQISEARLKKEYQSLITK